MSLTATQPRKLALVTGGAQRIGAQICRTLHSAGYVLALHYRSSADEAEKIRSELNDIRSDSPFCIAANLNIHDDVINLADSVNAIYGKLDVLVNNASSFYPTPIGTVDESQWDDLFNSNIKVAFFLSQALINPLKENQGCIINIVDIHSSKPLKNYPAYSMAKAALAMMTMSLAKVLGPVMRVNVVSAGGILWPVHEINDSYKQQHVAIIEKIALNRTVKPAAIAYTVLFLATQAPYITEQIIAVDGGRSLNC